MSSAAASCPDWRRLARRRASRTAEAEAAWDRAVAHLDGGCDACRRTAIDAEPLLVFRRLPAAPEAADEVARMQRAVASARRDRRVEAAAADGRGRSTGAWRAAAGGAALLLLALAAGGPGPSVPTGRSPGAPGGGPADLARGVAPVAGAPAAAERVAAAPAAGAARPRPSGMPILEGLDRPNARVYQLRERDLSVVMIVDASLDV